jgi:ABC-2 type transport system permease protein
MTSSHSAAPAHVASSATASAGLSKSSGLATMRRFRSPATVIARFVARRTMRGAALWALAFGIIVASKSIGYASAYPTLAARTKVAASFAQNVGLKAILGVPRNIEIVASGAAWNTMGAMALIGSIWAFLLATKTFRGEEDAGRWELLLTGQTTAARAAANTLGGLAASLAVLYAIITGLFIAIGSYHTVDFGVQAALFFALSAISGAAMFLTIGALASQLMPTRSRAAGLSAVIFGVSFLLRAMADTTGAHWLSYVTPLGWVEKLQPLYQSQPVWLIPIVAVIVACSVLTIFLAGRRDLGTSIVADRDSAPAHTRLLVNPLSFAVRLTRLANLSWLLALGLIALFFGVLDKTAAQAFSGSAGAGHVVRHLVHSAQQFGAKTFLGVVFLMLMTLTMVCVTNALGAMREEEAAGYLDNLLVRPVSRLRWLGGRVVLVVLLIVLLGVVASVSVWLGVASQHTGIAFHSLVLAGCNLLAPALLMLGIGLAALGLVPRLTTIVAYTVIAWSFLIQILGSGLNLSHWILDTSIFSHVALAPAVNPDWTSFTILIALGVALTMVGLAAFNIRDLQTE